MNTVELTEERIVQRRWLGRAPLIAILIGVGVLVAAIAVWWLTKPGDWYAFYPGSANPTEDVVSVEGIEIFPNEGELYFMTVSSRQISAIERFALSFDDTVNIVDKDKVLGTGTADERRVRNLQLMDGSQRAAIAVAIDYLGVEIETVPGALLTTVQVGSAAHLFLNPGDLVVKFGGSEIATPSDLVDAVRSFVPGDEVEVVYLHGSSTESGTVILGENDEGIAFLGVSVGVQLDLPVDVVIDAGNIGGPSAGLAWTLTLVDLLTEGELTGLNRVAVTGTINYDEDFTVGPIGGVTQKTYAAREQGIEYFIVPQVDAEDARDASGGKIQILAVETLQDAIDALVGIGGNGESLVAEGLLAAAAA